MTDNKRIELFEVTLIYNNEYIAKINVPRVRVELT